MRAGADVHLATTEVFAYIQYCVDYYTSLHCYDLYTYVHVHVCPCHCAHAFFVQIFQVHTYMLTVIQFSQRHTRMQRSYHITTLEWFEYIYKLLHVIIIFDNPSSPGTIDRGVSWLPGNPPFWLNRWDSLGAGIMSAFEVQGGILNTHQVQVSTVWTRVLS